ncbi:MAG: helix-turn-helix transcriptional regulator [Clostridia bacterium]|nr:helix-turn-helix transcriptional regulator [Clostridia bacterium]
MNVDYKLIGKRIKEERKKKGFTQENLAEKLDVTVGYISQVERGITKISLDLLASISSVLGVDPALLITETAVHQDRYMEGEFFQNYSLLSAKEKQLVAGFIELILKNR